MMLLASCATTPPKTGSLGEYYRNLEFGAKAGAKLRWGSRELISRNTRDLWSIRYVLFALAEDSESKVINRDEMKKLGDACTLAILEALKDTYPIESEPGPAVLRFRFAIVDLKRDQPRPKCCHHRPLDRVRYQSPQERGYGFMERLGGDNLPVHGARFYAQRSDRRCGG